MTRDEVFRIADALNEQAAKMPVIPREPWRAMLDAAEALRRLQSERDAQQATIKEENMIELPTLPYPASQYGYAEAEIRQYGEACARAALEAAAKLCEDKANSDDSDDWRAADCAGAIQEMCGQFWNPSSKEPDIWLNASDLARR